MPDRRKEDEAAWAILDRVEGAQSPVQAAPEPDYRAIEEAARKRHIMETLERWKASENRAAGKEWASGPGWKPWLARKADAFLSGGIGFGNYVDEIIGAVSGDPQRTEVARGIREADEEISGYGRIPLQIAGGVVTGLPLAAGLMHGGSALTAATKASPAARAVAGALIGGGSGAVEGAIEGYGAGEGPIFADNPERRESAKIGGAVGSVVGAGIGAASPFAYDAVRSIVRKGRQSKLFNKAAKKIGMSPHTARATYRAIDADEGFDPANLAELRKRGPEAMPADIGPATRAYLDANTNRIGPGLKIAQTESAARMARTGKVLSDTLDETLGPVTGPKAAAKALREGTQQIRGQQYAAAFDKPVDYMSPDGQELAKLYKKLPDSLINKGTELRGLDPDAVVRKHTLFSRGPDGKMMRTEMPDLEDWHYISRHIGDKAYGREGLGTLGGMDNEQRIYAKLYRKIRKHMNEVAPEYGDAVATARGAIEQKKALDLGYGMFRSDTITAEDVADAMAGMSKAERERVRQGARSFIDHQMSRVRRTIADRNMDAREGMQAVRMFSSRLNDTKLRLILGDGPADKVQSAINDAADALDLRYAVSKNSQTAARTLANEEVNAFGDSAAYRLRKGEVPKAGQRSIQYLFGTTPEDEVLAKDEQGRQIANFMMRNRGGDNAAQAIEDLADLEGLSPEQIASIVRKARRVTASGAAGLYTGGYELTDRHMNRRR